MAMIAKFPEICGSNSPTPIFRLAKTGVSPEKTKNPFKVEKTLKGFFHPVKPGNQLGCPFRPHSFGPPSMEQGSQLNLYSHIL